MATTLAAATLTRGWSRWRIAIVGYAGRYPQAGLATIETSSVLEIGSVVLPTLSINRPEKKRLPFQYDCTH